MLKTIKIILYTTCLCLSVSACKTTTLGTGVVQGQTGTGSSNVSFLVEENAFSDQVSAVATFSNGERYIGAFVIQKTQTNSSTDIWDFGDTNSNELNIGSSGSLDSSSTTYSSSATGVLFGPSGKSMECGMTLAAPARGFSGGAVGRCKLSTGELIPMLLNETY